MADEHEGCLKPDAWESQRERNIRYEKTFEKIENHLERQTNVMVQIASQGEQIAFILKRQEEDRADKKILFKMVREQSEKLAAHELADGKETKATFVSLKNGAFLIVVTAIVSFIVKHL